jgi:catechol 2,3-dioxygenase-like lactoylglutathione lyase family enzyme
MTIVIPQLPCASIDAMHDFYTALGFEQTYRQTRPNPYLAMRRGDIQLGFFGMPGFEPADSYSTCVIQVPDTGELHREFADGLRAALGKVPLAGIPRMTRPRPRRNVEGMAGFSVVDPGGNWLRIFPEAGTGAPPPAGKLAKALENAVVMSDSHGDPAQAAKIIDGALRRGVDEPAADRVAALAYRAELALAMSDPARAREALAELDRIELTAADRDRLADTLAAAEELRVTHDLDD